MKRLLHSEPVDRALRGAALVVTDRRWAAPLSAAALGFGIFAGVAIGPGASGGLATGAQQIVALPGSGGEGGQSGGGPAVASTGSAPPLEGGGEAGGLEEEAFGGATASFAPAAVEPPPAPPPAPAPAPQPAPAAPAPEEGKDGGQRFEGVVAAANHAAGSYALALDGGELVAVHAPELPEPGTKLSGPLRPLANTTYAEAGEIESGKTKAKAVSFEGTITWASPPEAPPSYTVSGRGVSLLVHAPSDPAGPVELPAIGSLVGVEARIEPPAEPGAAATLVQIELEVDRSLEPSTYLELAGIVEEVAPDGARLAFSAEWSGESGSTLDLAVPRSIDARKLAAGDSYLATAEVAPDGALALEGIAGDERVKGADDEAAAQGDLKR
jgi:hypothetical protein